MPLTDTKVKNAKSLDKEYKLTDGFGMFLRVTPKGSKYWCKHPARTNAAPPLVRFFSSSYPINVNELTVRGRIESKREPTPSRITPDPQTVFLTN